MKISCPECGTDYSIADTAIGSEGRAVRCARCETTWRVAAASDAAAESGDGSVPDVADEATLPLPPEAIAESAEGPQELNLNAWDPVYAADPAAEPAEAAPAGGGAPALRKRSSKWGSEGPARLTPPRPSGKSRKKVAIRSPGERYDRAGAIALVVLLAVLGGAVLFRGPVVAAVPNLAGLYALAGLDVNLRGLVIRDIRTTRDFENGVPGLIIEGEVRNVTRQEVEVPPIRLALQADSGQELYAWSVETEKRRLQADEAVGFRTRLASPPGLTRRVELRFGDKAVAGAR